MKKIFLTILILFLGIIPAFSAQTYNLNFNQFVADEADILTPQDEQHLNSVISELKDKTKTEIAVVTLKSLNKRPIEEVGLDIGRQYGVGDKKENTGLVFLVSPKDRKMRIEVGYGLEGILPDHKCGNIRDKYMIPQFKNGKYSKGIMDAVDYVSYYIAKSKKVSLNSISKEQTEVFQEQESSDNFRLVLSCIFFAIIILLVIGDICTECCYGYTGSSFGGSSFGSSSFGGSSFGGGSFGGGGCSGGW